MLDPNRPIGDYLDDFLHGVLADEDAARVQEWIDSAPEGKAALAAAQRRIDALRELPPVEASERLIRRTLEKVEMKATKKNTWAKPALRTFLALAATALVIIGGTHLYYYNLKASPYSLRLVGQNRLLAGTHAALRLALLNQHSQEPVANVPIEVALYDPRTQESVTLVSFQSTSDATQSPRFELPAWKPGSYELRVVANTPSGAESLTETIELTRSWKLMLSTDKPLYQPGQTIHLRSLALRRPDLKPVANRPVTFSITDPKGNVIFKSQQAASKFGIASADCALASEINEGEYQLQCAIGDVVSQRTVKVEKYVLPKFKVGINFDKPFYGPGEKVSGHVQADYFFGQPVASGEVKIDVRNTDVETNVLHQATVTTDAQGKANFEFTLPQQLVGRPQDDGGARFQLFATVTDSAGQKYVASASRLVTGQPIQIDIILEGGAPVRDLPNIVYIHASYADGRPAKVKLTVNGSKEPLATNDLGIASLEITPTDHTLGITVSATDDQGRIGRGHTILTCGQLAGDFLLRSDKAVYQGGDTMNLTALGGGVEPVFVDLIKDGQALLSQSIDVTNGQGKLAIDLPPEVFGSLQLVAYRFDQNGLAVRKTRLVFVHQASNLKIAATMNKPEYRPGEQATVKFTLTDDAGKASPGAISLAVVDEAVFSVLAQRPGLEQAFFLAEQELLRPVYTVYPDWSPNVDPSPQPDRQLLENAVFALTAATAGQDFKFDVGLRGPLGQAMGPVLAGSPFTLVANSFPAKEVSVTANRKLGLRGVAIAWFALLSIVFMGSIVAFAVWQPKIFMIVAGVLLAITLCVVPTGFALVFLAASRDVAFETAKKSEAHGDARNFREATETSAEDFMPEPRALEGAEPTAAPAPPPRVRQHFPETLFWQPELVTDDNGQATLELPLADSITTWRISASAVTAGGQLGDARFDMKVFQPFFVDVNLPVSLTRNDEVEMPVVVYNYSPQPQTVRLELERKGWFDLIVAAGEDAAQKAVQSLDLKPGEVRSTSYRLHVKDVGQQVVKITATAGGVADAIERAIAVVPNGQLVEHVKNATFDGQPIELEVNVPADTVPGSLAAFVKLHPSGFSQLVEGLDAIFQMPSGCFEQTSSTTYPNVLALDYLRATGKNAPQVEAKARQYIHAGYQKLVAFEINGGGFDWFGNPPANRTLTAYGLSEFVDMARVHDVDPRLIERTRRWLLSQRKPDGTWEPEPHMLNDGLAGTVNRGDDVRLAATAYIAWSVFHSLPPTSRTDADKQQFTTTVDYLLTHRPEAIADPYVLASVALAIAAFDPQHPELGAYLARLDSLKTQDANKMVHWELPGAAPRPFFGEGPSGSVETTAMATLALLTAKQYPATTKQALTWIVANKDSRGTWHSTQATVLALKALLLGSRGGEEKERRFEILVGDKVVQTLMLPANQSDVMQQVNLTPHVTGGGIVTFKELTDTGTMLQAVLRYHRDVPAEVAPADKETLAITLAYDRQRLTVDETVAATATIVNQSQQVAPMVIVDLPIPGGFRLEPGELDELIGSKKIEKYQITPTKAVVYLRQIAPGAKLELRYRLKATMPVKVTVPAAAAYEYYNPAKRAASQASALEAIGA